MNRLLRIAGLVLALMPLAYPYDHLLRAAERSALWPAAGIEWPLLRGMQAGGTRALPSPAP